MERGDIRSFFERKRKGGDITNEPNTELTQCVDVKSVNSKKRKSGFNDAWMSQYQWLRRDESGGKHERRDMGVGGNCHSIFCQPPKIKRQKKT